jgi:hypothetical protein
LPAAAESQPQRSLPGGIRAAVMELARLRRLK